MPSMPSIWVRFIIAGVALLSLAAVVGAHFAASPTYANGRVVEFDTRVAGPYEIALGKIPPTPIVGSLYLSIVVIDVSSQDPVMDANVVVTAIGPGASEVEVGPIMVDPDPDSQSYAGYYDTQEAIVLDRPGEWLFTVSVDGAPGGEGVAEFPVEVTTPNPITGIITLVALVSFIVVVALAIRMFLRERRRSRSGSS